MQLMPATAQRFGVSNPFNIEQNIRAGAEYLSYLSQLFNGDLRLVLAAYAAGEGRVQQRGLAYSHAWSAGLCCEGQRGLLGEA